MQPPDPPTPATTYPTPKLHGQRPGNFLAEASGFALFSLRLSIIVFKIPLSLTAFIILREALLRHCLGFGNLRWTHKPCHFIAVFFC